MNGYQQEELTQQDVIDAILDDVYESCKEVFDKDLFKDNLPFKLDAMSFHALIGAYCYLWEKHRAIHKADMGKPQ